MVRPTHILPDDDPLAPAESIGSVQDALRRLLDLGAPVCPVYWLRSSVVEELRATGLAEVIDLDIMLGRRGPCVRLTALGIGRARAEQRMVA